MSYAEFVVFEEQSLTKHEWLDGFVRELHEKPPEYWPTVGHCLAKLAIIRNLGMQLRKTNFEVLDSAREITVLATGFVARPDASVLCGRVETDPKMRNAITNPRVIVEVLSDSTEAYDRGEKFAHYRRIPSLAEYVMVSQNEPRIEVWRRNAAGKWELAEEALAGQTAALASIECVLSVDDVYADPLADAPGDVAGDPSTNPS